jgi:hypothetical protein
MVIYNVSNEKEQDVKTVETLDVDR